LAAKFGKKWEFTAPDFVFLEEFFFSKKENCLAE